MAIRVASQRRGHLCCDLKDGKRKPEVGGEEFQANAMTLANIQKGKKNVT